MKFMQLRSKAAKISYTHFNYMHKFNECITTTNLESQMSWMVMIL